MLNLTTFHKHPAFNEILKHYQTTHTFELALKTILAFPTDRNSFFKKGYNLLNPVEQEFIKDVFTMTFYISLNKVKSAYDYPEFLEKMRKHSVLEVETIFSAMFDAFQANSEYSIGVSPFKNHINHDNLFETFNKSIIQLHHDFTEKFWHHRLVANNGGVWGNLASNPFKQELLSNLQAEDFYHMLISRPNNYNTRFPNLYKLIIEAFPKDKEILNHFTSTEFKGYFTDYTSAKDWSYHWTCFLLKKTQDEIDNINKILDKMKVENHVVWQNTTDFIRKWETKNKKQIFNLPPEHKINSLDEISIQTISAKTFIFKMEDIQRYILNQFKESSIRYPASIKDDIVKAFSEAVSEDSVFFQLAVTGQAIKIKDKMHLTLTFHYQDMGLTNEQVSDFYELAITKVLSNQKLQINSQELHIFEQEYIIDKFTPEKKEVVKSRSIKF